MKKIPQKNTKLYEDIGGLSTAISDHGIDLKKINQSFNRLVNAIRKMLEETGGHINHLI